MLLSFSDFIGRFHPLLVHLPIGILLIGCFFQLLTFNQKYSFLRPAVPVLIFWGMIGAVASAITGYFLSLSGDYEGTIVNRHKWLGISTAVLSILLYAWYKVPVRETTRKWITPGLIILIIITGHSGGSLTHGEGFLTEGLESGKDKGPVLETIPNIQEAAIYADIVQPILKARCYNCHGPNKQKGKLRLDSREFIFKGGKEKEGKTVVPGKPGESEMIRRISLPLSDEDHMPLKEKPQLTQNEIALLRWWVNSGADFTKKIKELEQTADIKPILQTLQSGSSEKTFTDIPATPVKPAPAASIDRLRKAGVIIIPVAQNSNYLSANFVTVAKQADSLVKLLEPLDKQLIWLKLDHAVITDTAMEIISKLKSLTRLQLSNTLITDKGLVKLQSLEQLQSLNLVNTNITSRGILQLKNLKNLKYLYLYQSKITAGEWSSLQKAFPGTVIDSGKYVVPFLPTDTVVVKY